VTSTTVIANRVQAAPVGIRSISAGVDFVYVMRRDTEYVSAQFASRLAATGHLAEIEDAYEHAVERIAEAVLAAFSATVECPAVDLLDAREIHAQRLSLLDSLGPATVVSMDPLMEAGTLPLAFSRCYRIGGAEFIEMVPRPGYPTLEQQVEKIASVAGEGPIAVVEDDFFTGATLTTMLGQHLGDLLLQVRAVVAGTKVGPAEPDFPVIPAVRYVCADDTDPLEKVDLGDPRDYLVGASGLVCRLASGKLGRLPYVLPFVSPAARASIPVVAEGVFSAKALEVSGDFYRELSDIVGQPVMMDAADPAFALACEELLGVPQDCGIAEALDIVAERGGALLC